MQIAFKQPATKFQNEGVCMRVTQTFKLKDQQLQMTGEEMQGFIHDRLVHSFQFIL